MLRSNVTFAKVETWFCLLTNSHAKCDVCECVLLTKTGYVNHMKANDNNTKQSSYTNINNTDVVCNKICKSASDLKRHMVVHKKATASRPDQSNQTH